VRKEWLQFTILYIIIGAALFSTFGCAGILYPGTQGTERITDQSIVKQIKPGVTQMQEVRALLGPPKRITQSSTGETKWFYTFMSYWFYKYEANVLNITFRDGIVKEVSYGEQEEAMSGPGEFKPTMDEGRKPRVTLDTVPQTPPPTRPAYSNTEKKISEYWCWGLGVAVKTDTTTTVTEFIEDSRSPAKNLLQIGDEIIGIGKIDIVSTNAYKILTKELPTEKNGLVTVVVRRDGKDIKYQFRPNKFK